jgi:hypothetical protein
MSTYAEKGLRGWQIPSGSTHDALSIISNAQQSTIHRSCDWTIPPRVQDIVNEMDLGDVTDFQEVEHLWMFHNGKLPGSSRGTIVKVDSRAHVISSMPSTPTSIVTDDKCAERVDAIAKQDEIKSIVLTQFFEGCAVRMFYDDKWYITSMRKIDAANSTWGRSTTMAQFYDSLKHVNIPHDDGTTTYGMTLDQLKSRLDTCHQYLFVIKPITCDAGKGAAILPDGDAPLHLATMIDDVWDYMPDDIGILRPDASICHPDMFGQAVYCMTAACNNINIRIPGPVGYIIIITRADDHVDIINMVNPEWSRRCKIRGNVSTLQLRHLQLIKNPEPDCDSHTLECVWDMETFNRVDKTIAKVMSHIGSRPNSLGRKMRGIVVRLVKDGATVANIRTQRVKEAFWNMDVVLQDQLINEVCGSWYPIKFVNG